jgi:hypothetical protein
MSRASGFGTPDVVDCATLLRSPGLASECRPERLWTGWAGKKDWRAKEAWLRLSFQSDYRAAGAKVEVNTNAQAGVVVLTQEKRRELQERLARLQALLTLGL